jgi:archaellum component FlaC
MDEKRLEEIKKSIDDIGRLIKDYEGVKKRLNYQLKKYEALKKENKLLKKHIENSKESETIDLDNLLKKEEYWLDKNELISTIVALKDQLYSFHDDTRMSYNYWAQDIGEIIESLCKKEWIEIQRAKGWENDDDDEDDK